MSPANLRAEKQSEKVITAKRAVKHVEVGRITSVGSSQVVISVNKSIIRNNQLHLVELGTVLKILTNSSLVVAMVSTLKVGGADDEGMNDGCIAHLSILGEISTNKTTRQTKFFRGVRTFPVLNQPALTMKTNELELIFSTGSAPSIAVGRMQQDDNIVARVKTNDLLSKHFAIIGSTGSGKSCTVALVLQAILDENPSAHMVLFDPHNEYSKSFGDMASVIGPKEFDLPIWLFDFEETAELLTSEIFDHKSEEIEVLNEVILKAKQLYDRASQTGGGASAKIEDLEHELHRAASHISLDSPVPYKMRDVIKLLDYYMGRLENSGNIGPYKRLKRRINSLMADPRYQFIFRNQAAPRSIQDITGAIFRIPVAGKPMCILDFSGIPSGTMNIVVSVVSRLAFELAMWSQRKIPILLVCEEAHRYIPADKSLGFAATRRSISRIAKEGRKYGVSLAIISQRPSELEPSTLSQCSTIFSMRLGNERDQNFVRAAIPDGAADLLSFLPSLGTAETMVFGESVNLPMRVILDNLAEERRPHSSSAEFTELWNSGDVSPEFMTSVFESWRSRTRVDTLPETQTAPALQVANPQTNRTRNNLLQGNPQQIAPQPVHSNVGNAVPVHAQGAGGMNVKKMLNRAFHSKI
ncbi:MAG: ATP-binding protein [Robiginitomaculum sp.]|nr:ATP-binding protein [Robiginitomaculum sp.]